MSVNGLIEILFDKTAEFGDREDAAMDLRLYPREDKALEALRKTGSDPEEDELIAASCGESIGEILVERGEFRREVIEHLVPIAKMEAVGFINARKPEWIEEYNLEESLK